MVRSSGSAIVPGAVEGPASERSSPRAGIASGVLGGLAMILVNLGLRQAAGIPLPVEVASDRVIPLLSISQFSSLAKLLGGLDSGRIVAVGGTMILQMVLAIVGGVLYDRLARREAPGSRRAGIQGLLQRPTVLIALVLLGVWGLGVAALWPALESNYRGIPPGSALVIGALGLLGSFAIYGVVMVATCRLLRVGEPIPALSPSGSGGTGRASGMPRRAVLGVGLGTILALSSGELLRRLFARATIGPAGYDGLRVSGPTTQPVTPNDRFYVVTKNIIDPEVDRDLWRLEVSGRVADPRTYTYRELTALSSADQLTTLECISNGVGGGLMSNAEWRGIPLRALIERAGPLPGDATVLFHAADGYTHAISPERALRPTTLVVYEMNGEPLPRRHGFPVRIIAPGAYGEVNVKWVDRVELVEGSAEGYYERQGWKPQFVETTSRYDSPRSGQSVRLGTEPTIPLRGVAFAGDRGISGVEVSTDGGRTWSEARIGYHPSPLTWALWSADWRPDRPGEYQLVVRATDGAGTLQSARERSVAPAGATGYHRVTVRVEV
ncbi:molybdopterin-dependent oxidoreductase [soil metagenome]